MMHGKLYTAHGHNTRAVSAVFDFATGDYSIGLDYAFNYTSGSSFTYITNTVYVPATDTLYVQDTYGGGRLYKLESASSIIPEPASLSLLAIGTLLFRRAR
jgi:hypothetical protein